jgi:3'-5' exoribonuclease
MATTTFERSVRDWKDGTSVDAVLLVRNVEGRRKRDGSPYLRLTLADRSGSVSAVLWDPSEVPGVAPGDAVHVTGHPVDHPRYGRELTIRTLRRPEQHEIPWDDLVERADRPIAELCDDLDWLVASIRSSYLSHLVTRVLDPESSTGQAFRDSPAAMFNHHAYPGGLLEHSVAVAQLADAAAALLPNIDRDLAVSGALLHDIGKLEGYAATRGGADFTDAGRLEGEIPLGYYRVRREMEEIPGFPDELARSLLHVILAHHGCLEHGSPVVPGTREAALVHAMDDLSGQLGAFDRLERETPAGERWSRYDGVLGGRAFFADA